MSTGFHPNKSHALGGKNFHYQAGQPTVEGRTVGRLGKDGQPMAPPQVFPAGRRWKPVLPIWKAVERRARSGGNKPRYKGKRRAERACAFGQPARGIRGTAAWSAQLDRGQRQVGIERAPTI